MKISLIYKNTAEVVFENIKGFRAGISILTIFDKFDREHMFQLEELQAIYVNQFEEKKNDNLL